MLTTGLLLREEQLQEEICVNTAIGHWKVATSEDSHDGKGQHLKTSWQRIDKTQLASLLSVDL